MIRHLDSTPKMLALLFDGERKVGLKRSHSESDSRRAARAWDGAWSSHEHTRPMTLPIHPSHLTFKLEV